MPNSVNRTSNYFGKSNCGNSNADAIYDEIKIYQESELNLDNYKITNQSIFGFSRIENYCNFYKGNPKYI